MISWEVMYVDGCPDKEQVGNPFGYPENLDVKRARGIYTSTYGDRPFEGSCPY